MTIEEASHTYGIPMSVLKEYERWGLCGEVKKVGSMSIVGVIRKMK